MYKKDYSVRGLPFLPKQATAKAHPKWECCWHSTRFPQLPRAWTSACPKHYLETIGLSLRRRKPYWVQQTVALAGSSDKHCCYWTTPKSGGWGQCHPQQPSLTGREEALMTCLYRYCRLEICLITMASLWMTLSLTSCQGYMTEIVSLKYTGLVLGQTDGLF